jgi:hypothetical protein
MITLSVFLINKEEQAAGEVPFGSPGVGPLFSQVSTSPTDMLFFLCNVWILDPIKNVIVYASHIKIGI